jgi:hypothetical protein
MAMRGEGYLAKRISTFAVEDEWSRYDTLADAIGMAYQIGGHETVAYWFPTGNAWWSYDTSTGYWHERTYSDLATAWLPRCMAGWGAISPSTHPNSIIAGDRTAPRILEVSRMNYTDCGVPIIRQRAWPHAQADGKRLAHTRFAAAFDGALMSAPDEVTLDWSDDQGHTYGAPLLQSGASPSGQNQHQWRRLGSTRDRVYRLTWTRNGPVALNGAWVDVLQQGT